MTGYELIFGRSDGDTRDLCGNRLKVKQAQAMRTNRSAIRGIGDLISTATVPYYSYVWTLLQ